MAIFIWVDLVPCLSNQTSDLGLLIIGRLPREMLHDILCRSIPKFDQWSPMKADDPPPHFISIY